MPTPVIRFSLLRLLFCNLFVSHRSSSSEPVEMLAPCTCFVRIAFFSAFDFLGLGFSHSEITIQKMFNDTQRNLYSMRNKVTKRLLDYCSKATGADRGGERETDRMKWQQVNKTHNNGNCNNKKWISPISVTQSKRTKQKHFLLTILW